MYGAFFRNWRRPVFLTERTIEETLQKNGYLCMTPLGNSMLPLLRGGRDTIYLEQSKGRLKRGDIALYRSKDGRYVLHRVIAVYPGYYEFRGDNSAEADAPVEDGQVLGVLKKFYRGGRWIECSSRACRIYSAIWLAMYPVRRIFIKFRHRAARVLKKMMGMDK